TTKILMNRASSDQVIHVTVLGPNGERNQFGRVVRVAAEAKPRFVMTEVVDGGSGYLANTPYTLQFATPYPGKYLVDVGLADRLVELEAAPGDNLTIYANGQTQGAAKPALVTLRPIKP